MGNRYAVGDIHGGYLALDQVLQMCGFDFEKDTLFPIGDVCDGWPQTFEVIELLLSIKNLIPIMGNHDWWLQNWLHFGDTPSIWLEQGGYETIKSYEGKSDSAKWRHLIEYFNRTHFYYEEDNMLFVHGGFKDDEIKFDSFQDLMWDRTLWKGAMSAKNVQLKRTKQYDKVFIGHTATKDLLPNLKGGNVWNLDTGAGYDGRLTIMNIDTTEYHQSHLLSTLYPKEFAKREAEFKRKQTINNLIYWGLI